MKLLITLIMATSFSAFACPDLTGVYTKCEANSNRDIPAGLNFEVKMTNSISYFITIDSENGTQSQEVIADGIERETYLDTSQIGRVRVKVTSSCTANELTVLAKTRVLGIKVEETTKYSKVGDTLKVDRLKRGRVIESAFCR